MPMPVTVSARGELETSHRTLTLASSSSVTESSSLSDDSESSLPYIPQRDRKSWSVMRAHGYLVDMPEGHPLRTKDRVVPENV